MNGKNQRLQSKIRNSLTVFLMFCGIFVFGNNIYAQNCKYDKKGAEVEIGGHILVEVELGEVRKIRGKIMSPIDESIPGAITKLYRIESGKKNFIGLQKSDADGNFCFKGMKKGNYELHIGAIGFNGAVYYLQLNSANNKLSAEIKVDLMIGT